MKEEECSNNNNKYVAGGIKWHVSYHVLYVRTIMDHSFHISAQRMHPHWKFRTNGTTNNGGIPTINMAGEVDDDDGNYALHLFLLNKSYSRATNNSDTSNENELLYAMEVNILSVTMHIQVGRQK